MKLRKRIAAMGAAMVMAVSMMSVGASAANSGSWNVVYKNQPGAPSTNNGNITTTRTITYSVYGAKACVDGASVSISGTTGCTYVYCLNYNMNRKVLSPSVGTYVICYPSIERLTKGYPKYYFEGSTSRSGNTFKSNGTIAMR